jgi:hypothetical protein
MSNQLNALKRNKNNRSFVHKEKSHEKNNLSDLWRSAYRLMLHATKHKRF